MQSTHLQWKKTSTLIPENLNASDGGLRHINIPNSSSKPRAKAFSAKITYVA
jgi:hypothetical protein